MKRYTPYTPMGLKSTRVRRKAYLNLWTKVVGREQAKKMFRMMMGSRRPGALSRLQVPSPQARVPFGLMKTYAIGINANGCGLWQTVEG